MSIHPFRHLLAAAALLAATSAAHADTLTEGPFSFGTYSSGSSGTFSIPSFDSTLGTLTSIDLFVTGSSNGGSNSLQNLSQLEGSAAVDMGQTSRSLVPRRSPC